MTGPLFNDKLTIPTFHLGQTIRTHGPYQFLVGRIVQMGPWSDNLYIPGRYYDLPNMWVTMHVLGERHPDRDIMVTPDNPNKLANYLGNYTSNIMSFEPYIPNVWPKRHK